METSSDSKNKVEKFLKTLEMGWPYDSSSTYVNKTHCLKDVCVHSYVPGSTSYSNKPLEKPGLLSPCDRWDGRLVTLVSGWWLNICALNDYVVNSLVNNGAVIKNRKNKKGIYIYIHTQKYTNKKIKFCLCYYMDWTSG